MNLTKPLLSDYQGNEDELLKKLDEKIKQQSNALDKVFSPKERVKIYFNLIPATTNELLTNINYRLNDYNSLPSKENLHEIIEACNIYIESIPFSQRQKGFRETWTQVLSEWPYIERVFAIQKQAVNKLFLPDEKTDARRRFRLFREIIGVEDKSKYKGKILEQQFWGEYKFRGNQFILSWLMDSNIETSYYLRSYREWTDFHHKLSNRDKNKVSYFQPSLSLSNKVIFKDKLAYFQEKPLDYPREIIYVMDSSGNLYVSPKKELDHDFHHSSLLGGKKVICAGDLLVKSGKIHMITNNSGHYKPKRQHLVQALKIMQDNHGLDLNEIIVKDLSRFDSDEEINGLRYLKTAGLALADENKFRK